MEIDALALIMAVLFFILIIVALLAPQIEKRRKRE